MSQILTTKQEAQKPELSQKPALLDEATKKARFAELQAIGVIKRGSKENEEYERLRVELGLKP